MAITKTPYGLVYNEDGSLCYTERPDDVPFDGVTSWAVEEGTTNLVGNPDVGSNMTTPIGIVKGYTLPDTQYTTDIKNIGTVGISLTGTHTYTYSFWCKNNMTDVKMLLVQLYSYQNFNKQFYFVPPNDNQWHYYTSPPMTINYDSYSHQNPVRFYIYGANYSGGSGDVTYAGIQVEEKPYATSFVDGTRAPGKLLFRDIFTQDKDKDFVVNFWLKMQSRGGYSESDSLRFNNLFHLWALYPNSTSSDNRTLIFDYSNISQRCYQDMTCPKFDDWHMLTIIYKPNLTINGNVNSDYPVTTQIYYDTVMYVNRPICNLTYYNELQPNGELLFEAPYRHSFYIADVFVGDYYDKNGNVIWTDDYIKNLYHMRKPFNSRVLKGGR